MKKILEDICKIKPMLKIVLSSGKELNLNLKIYSVDLDKYEDAILFVYKDIEYIAVRYSDIVMISYTNKQFS